MEKFTHFLRLPAVQLVLAIVLSLAILVTIAVMDLALDPRPSLILSRAIGALLAFGVLLLLGRGLQRKTLEEIGVSPRGASPLIVLGVLIGAVMMGTIAGLMGLAGWYKVASLNFDALALGRTLIAFFFVALFEELLFRAILFRQLDNVFGSWIALAISGALFGAMHFANPGATLWTTLALAVFGMGIGAAYLLARNVWVAVGLHWAWNFLLGPIFGFAVSGNATYALLTATSAGPDLWTGGAFGPEAGLLALIVTTLASAAMLWVASRRKHLSPSPRASAAQRSSPGF